MYRATATGSLRWAPTDRWLRPLAFMMAVAVGGLGCDSDDGEDPQETNETSESMGTGMPVLSCADISACLEMTCSSQFMALAAESGDMFSPAYMKAKRDIVDCIEQCGVSDFDTKQDECGNNLDCAAYVAVLACTPGSATSADCGTLQGMCM